MCDTSDCYYFRATYWTVEKRDGERDSILVYGRDINNKTIGVRIVNCYAYCYVKIPEECKVASVCAEAFERELNERINNYNSKFAATRVPIPLPLSVDFYEGISVRGGEPCDYFKITMPSESNKYTISYVLKYGKISSLCGVSANSLVLCESRSQIGTIFQITTDRDLCMGGWLKVQRPESWPQDLNRVFEIEKEHSRVDINVTCFPYNISRASNIPDTKNINPLILSFDLEAFSHKQNAMMPNPLDPKDMIVSISSRIGYHNTPAEQWEGVTLSLCDCRDTRSDYRVLNYDSERLLLIAFSRLIKERNPDIITGYNIFGFDWYYIYKRCLLFGIFDKFATFGRYYYEQHRPEDNLKTSDWQSSAYGKQLRYKVEGTGILQLDVITEIQVTLSVKLPTYTLNSVSEHYLKDTKKDLPIPELLRILHYRVKLLETRDLSLKERKKTLLNMFEPHQIVGAVKEVYDLILISVTHKQLYDAISYGIELINEYCDKDALLPARIIQKVRLFLNVQQLSIIRRVPMEYHGNRGQGIKTLALMYPYLKEERYVLDDKEVDAVVSEQKDKYKGATVLSAVAGLHKEVAVTDFSSLYPSSMMDKNICLTTLVAKSVDTRDPEVRKLYPKDEYNIITILEDHRGCGCENSTPIEDGESTVCNIVQHVFRKKEEHEGLFPKVLRCLLNARSAVRKTLENETDEVIKNILDLRQLSLKVAANSMYGVTGSRTSVFYERAVAESVTAAGRRYLKMACDFILSNYPGIEVIYGDSVSADTPVVLKHRNRVFVRTIDNLPSSEWFTSVDGKQYAVPMEGLQVWSDDGFVDVVSVMRHKTRKQMFQVSCCNGSVTVTSDHSLLNNRKEAVKPNEVGVGSELLFNVMPSLSGNMFIPQAWLWGLFFSNGRCDSGKCWVIYDSNINYLRLAQEMLKKLYNNDLMFKVAENNKGGYKIVVQSYSRDTLKIWIRSWYRLFYHKRNKKVPDLMFSADLESRQNFCSVCFRDGTNSCVVIGNIGAAGLYLLHSSLGYRDNINHRQKEPKGRITSIERTGRTRQYVYDLQTTNHHFSAGVGELVVHNTDSCMLKFVSDEYLALPRKDRVLLSQEISRRTSEYFGGPIKLNFENYCMSFVQIKKKNYIADIWEMYKEKEIQDMLSLIPEHREYMINPNEEYDRKKAGVEELTKLMTNVDWSNSVEELKHQLLLSIDRQEGGRFAWRLWKGVMAKKRGFCNFSKRVYKELIDKMMTGDYKLDDIMHVISQSVNTLFHPGKIPLNDFIISCGVKDLDEYASNDSLPYLLGKRFAIEERPIQTPARIEYVFVERDFSKASEQEKAVFLNKNGKPYKGSFAEEYVHFLYNKGLKINRNMYIETVLGKDSRNSICTLIDAVFKYEKMSYERPEDRAKCLRNKIATEETYCDFDAMFPEEFFTGKRKTLGIQPNEVGIDKMCNRRCLDNDCVKPCVKPVVMSLTEKRRQETRKTLRMVFGMIEAKCEPLIKEVEDVVIAAWTRLVLSHMGLQWGRSGVSKDADGKHYKLRNYWFMKELSRAHKQKRLLLKELTSRPDNVKYLFQC